MLSSYTLVLEATELRLAALEAKVYPECKPALEDSVLCPVICRNGKSLDQRCGSQTTVIDNSDMQGASDNRAEQCFIPNVVPELSSMNGVRRSASDTTTSKISKVVPRLSSMNSVRSASHTTISEMQSPSTAQLRKVSFSPRDVEVSSVAHAWPISQFGRVLSPRVVPALAGNDAALPPRPPDRIVTTVLPGVTPSSPLSHSPRVNICPPSEWSDASGRGEPLKRQEQTFHMPLQTGSGSKSSSELHNRPMHGSLSAPLPTYVVQSALFGQHGKMSPRSLANSGRSSFGGSCTPRVALGESLSTRARFAQRK